MSLIFNWYYRTKQILSNQKVFLMPSADGFFAQWISSFRWKYINNFPSVGHRLSIIWASVEHWLSISWASIKHRLSIGWASVKHQLINGWAWVYLLHGSFPWMQFRMRAKRFPLKEKNNWSPTPSIEWIVSNLFYEYALVYHLWLVFWKSDCHWAIK